MMITDLYDVVIGLEVHVQLNTTTKLFSADANLFGAQPNTHTSPITLGHPGTVLFLNKEAITKAVQMGIACNCTITEYNYFARKNYFYPDLPKGYQISQHTVPICVGGQVYIHLPEGGKHIQLNRIHLEEDAGKSIHDANDAYTLLDYNRAGVPLIEIVTEPCLQSAEEAYQYLTEIRKLVRWVGVSDGNMEEGSLRCDANISLKPKGATTLGTKVEVKNLNSIRNVKKAIEVEVERMAALLQEGEPIVQQTRSFNADNDTTFALRDKEEANDYRYFPEPDAAPFLVTDEVVKTIQQSLPPLPYTLYQEFTKAYALSHYDALQLLADKGIATYFTQVVAEQPFYKTAVNFICGPLKAVYQLHQGDTVFPLPVATTAAIVQLIHNKELSFSVVTEKLLPYLLQHPSDAVTVAVEKLGLIENTDDADVLAWVNQALTNHPDKVAAYLAGKKAVLGALLGEVKRLSAGKANPQKIQILLEQQLQLLKK